MIGWACSSHIEVKQLTQNFNGETSWKVVACKTEVEFGGNRLIGLSWLRILSKDWLYWPHDDHY